MPARSPNERSVRICAARSAVSRGWRAIAESSSGSNESERPSCAYTRSRPNMAVSDVGVCARAWRYAAAAESYLIARLEILPAEIGRAHRIAGLRGRHGRSHA